MEMRCGLGPARNRVHVHVKGTWRRGVEPDLAARLFASLSQRGRGERATIRFLGMPAWLQPPTQLGVMHEAHSPARRIGDHRAAGEMGGKLIAGEGILEQSAKVLIWRRSSVSFRSSGSKPSSNRS